MIWWILLWLGHSSGGGPVVPTPDPLPFLIRNGAEVSSRPTFIRRVN